MTDMSTTHSIQAAKPTLANLRRPMRRGLLLGWVSALSACATSSASVPRPTGDTAHSRETRGTWTSMTASASSRSTS